MIDPITQYILNEGYVLSDKTISVDLDKFKNGKAKRLLIVGLSGSGKTTMGKILSKSIHVKLRSTDDVPFDWNVMQNGTPEIKKRVLDDYLKGCEKLIFDKIPGIVEGVGIIESYYKNVSIRNKMLKYPCIILGTSVLKSGVQSSKRAKDGPLNFHFYKTNIQLYQKMLNRFRKDRIGVKNSSVKTI